jgi:branched-chain amino acid transport system ATP-binding protein
MKVLKVEKLAHSYGGLRVLTDISFTLEAGEKAALIGPNGAGKTTLFNVLSGFLSPSSGQIIHMGQDVTRMPAHARAARGLARSFQISTLFSQLTVLTNVLLAIHGTQSTRYQMLRSMMGYKKNLARAQELLELFDLWGKRDTPASELGHGEQRGLEILLSLASRPNLLLLDEPNAGLAGTENDLLVDMIQNLVTSTTVLLTAHDTDLVFKLADKVLVLYYGRILAWGTPKEIQRNPQVREIYLGTKENGDAGIGKSPYLL